MIGIFEEEDKIDVRIPDKLEFKRLFVNGVEFKPVVDEPQCTCGENEIHGTTITTHWNLYCPVHGKPKTDYVVWKELYDTIKNEPDLQKYFDKDKFKKPPPIEKLELLPVVNHGYRDAIFELMRCKINDLCEKYNEIIERVNGKC